jgi:hypothetical protein
MKNMTKSQRICIKGRDYFEDAGIDKKMTITWLNDILTNGLKITTYVINVHSPLFSNNLCI